MPGAAVKHGFIQESEAGPSEGVLRVTASRLREDIYNILDKVLEGAAVEVIRNGKTIKLMPVEKPDKLSRLKKRDWIEGDPEDLVHMDWAGEWRELDNLG